MAPDRFGLTVITVVYLVSGVSDPSGKWKFHQYSVYFSLGRKKKDFQFSSICFFALFSIISQ